MGSERVCDDVGEIVQGGGVCGEGGDVLSDVAAMGEKEGEKD